MQVRIVGTGIVGNVIEKTELVVSKQARGRTLFMVCHWVRGVTRSIFWVEATGRTLKIRRGAAIAKAQELLASGQDQNHWQDHMAAQA